MEVPSRTSTGTIDRGETMTMSWGRTLWIVIVSSRWLVKATLNEPGL